MYIDERKTKRQEEYLASLPFYTCELSKTRKRASRTIEPSV
jgi:hypothetical protein